MNMRRWFVAWTLWGIFVLSGRHVPAEEFPPLSVMTLGDSITKGARPGVTDDQTFAAELQRQLRVQGHPEAEITNVGIGGETAGQGLRRLERDVVARKPSIVTIMYGHNDSYVDVGKTEVRVPVARFRSDLSQLVQRLREAGITAILMTPPAYAEKSGPNGLGEHCNVKLSQYAEITRQVADTLQTPLIDHYAAWAERSQRGADLNEWTTDGYHPNPLGHVDLATRMLSVVQEQIPPGYFAKVPRENWSELNARLSGGSCWRKPGQLFLDIPGPDARQVKLPRLNNVVRSVSWIMDGPPHFDGVSLSQTPSEWTVQISENVPSEAVIALEVDGMPRLALTPAVSRPGAEGVITLSAHDAVVHGEKLQFEPLTHKNTVGYWVNPKDYAEWSYGIDTPGEFEVLIHQGCGGHAGSEVELGFPEGAVPFVVEETGHFQNFVWRSIGRISLKELGVQQVRLRCTKLAKGAVMDMRQIRLVPVGAATANPRDMRDVAPDLVPPAFSIKTPAPGQHVLRLLPNQPPGHGLYLPTNWNGGRKWPILVEWTGNGPYRNDRGDVSTGEFEQSQLAFGLSGGYDAICLSLPLVDERGASLFQWWGEAPDYDPAATVRYLKAAIADTCEKYGGDPSHVILVGFSRGSIAVNAVGLSSDEAAGLWKAAVCFSHYDGVQEWPFAGSDAPSARTRLQRLGNKPQFIVSESSASGPSQVDQTKNYLDMTELKGDFTFAATGFLNHSDRWALRPSPARQQIREWLKRQMAP
ncbi:MAG: hypothetical protein DWH91_16845 [Planctomycetota bacterium]|nr:MAG: hypothetical protein DWH91_16845 [Planctomycetota bacterium]